MNAKKIIVALTFISVLMVACDESSTAPHRDDKQVAELSSSSIAEDADDEDEDELESSSSSQKVKSSSSKRSSLFDDEDEMEDDEKSSSSRRNRSSSSQVEVVDSDDSEEDVVLIPVEGSSSSKQVDSSADSFEALSSAEEDAKPESSASIKDALSSAKESLDDLDDSLEDILKGVKVECSGEESDNEWIMNVDMTVDGIKMITANKSVFEGTTMITETTSTSAMGDKLTCEASLLAAKAQYAQEYDNVEASCDKDGTMVVKYTDSMEGVDAEKKAELYKEFKSACEADMSDLAISDLM